MNMPAFTAEASLYRNAGLYRMAGRFSQADVIVRPAIDRSNCYWNCLGNCEDDSYYCGHNCNCFCKGGPPRCQYK